ncbi:hypothetical protein K1T35_37940 [Pseudonocardia sp. DSM 110487]|uniref:hypothetical protein n=1 Tax=Pseudonocardia sp. DSM 110487 TaxID=2865833 RepID=UPI001C6A4EC5|nr:hypothetical protein [Pseudonocardia sp. DSM 110487]QYN34161.1 hypothetical protein K1T35_37940 [Pseudonocardia sp. DSM 110487]
MKYAFRLALAVVASLTVMATSAGPALAADCDQCMKWPDGTTYDPDAGNTPYTGSDGTEPGGNADPGWGVGNHIGEGGPDDPEEDPQPPAPDTGTPILGGGRLVGEPIRPESSE